MFDWLAGLDDLYLPRGQCGFWPYYMIVTALAADASIAIAYFWIPLTLWRIRRWERAHNRRVGRAWFRAALFGRSFGLFILACGVGHVTDCVVFYWPAYPFFTVVDLVTAAVSITVASSLHQYVSERLKYEAEIS